MVAKFVQISGVEEHGTFEASDEHSRRRGVSGRTAEKDQGRTEARDGSDEA